ncbi:MAG: hypothetical protein AAB036_05955 [Elusimicrobiota bacterium]
MRPWRSRGGQIVIPAMLLFPTLFLFVYLIYETAKLSKEKIRHQFAMDAAAFVEATNYSDFLNRTAYVNGAFPMRIFEQGYDDFPAECEGKVEHCAKVSYADLLYKNGIFPRSQSGKKEYKNEDVWDIAFGGKGVGKNSANPTLEDPVVLFTLDDANRFWHPFDLATEVCKLYVQVFSLLGSVEDAQWQVLKRLSKDSNHSFLQKSYFLNTGDASNYGTELARSFDAALGDFRTQAHCVRKITYYGNRHMGGTGLQQYQVFSVDPPETLPDSPGCGSGGLFQLQTVDDSVIRKLNSPGGSEYPGLSLSLSWQFPRQNYFNVDFGSLPQHFPSGLPALHTTVSVGHNSKAKVWPDPTPKFQVREFP